MAAKSEAAVRFFSGGSGLNCAQSVLSAFCEAYGLDQKTACRIACGLGGGVRAGEICGAVAGAVLVIGLKFGQADAEDKDAKKVCYAKTVEFLEAFRQEKGSIVCRELLRHDISTPDGYEEAKKENLFTTTCVDMVEKAAELLETLAY